MRALRSVRQTTSANISVSETVYTCVLFEMIDSTLKLCSALWVNNNTLRSIWR